MKCPNCGAENTGNYCKYCGSELPKQAVPVSVTNNIFVPTNNTSSSLPQTSATCPKCGSSNVSFKRERAGTTSKSSSRKKILTTGRKGQTISQTSYRTIGLCQNCGYSWNPNGNSVVSNTGSSKSSNFKWWVLGWIFVFPIPLTILMLRNKSLNKWLRYGIIGFAWLIYLIWIIAAGSNKDKKQTITENPTTVVTTVLTEPEETIIESETEGVIEVESIELNAGISELYIGQSTTVEVKIVPENATDQTITWKSTNEDVLYVDENGKVQAIGDGTASIVASGGNNIVATCDIVVDGSKRVMTVKVSATRDDNNNIGDEWSHQYKINDEAVSSEYLVSVGDSYSCWAQYVEDDSNPDKGSNSISHKVTQEDFDQGFEVQVEVYVKENGGSNSGKKAHYIVTFRFSPV